MRSATVIDRIRDSSATREASAEALGRATGKVSKEGVTGIVHAYTNIEILSISGKVQGGTSRESLNDLLIGTSSVL